MNLLSVETRKDFTDLIIKNGDDTVHIYLCPKSDEIAVTCSKVRQDASDVILARELAKGTDTLEFRDDKGSPLWDLRTGKCQNW